MRDIYNIQLYKVPTSSTILNPSLILSHSSHSSLSLSSPCEARRSAPSSCNCPLPPSQCYLTLSSQPIYLWWSCLDSLCMHSGTTFNHGNRLPGFSIQITEMVYSFPKIYSVSSKTLLSYHVFIELATLSYRFYRLPDSLFKITLPKWFCSFHIST